MGSNKVNPNRPTSRYTIMKTAKVKYKERMLMAVKKERKKSHIPENFCKTPRSFFLQNFSGQEWVAQYSKC